MTPAQKQSELYRHRDILLATMDYLLAAHGGSLVLDGEDFITDYYQQQKLQVTKYFEQRRLDRLQQRLASFIKIFQAGTDVNYTGYIREKTGYDLDIFADLKKRVDAIFEENEIRSQKEIDDVSALFHYYHKTATEPGKLDLLRKLMLTYFERTTAATSRKRKSGYSEVISKVEVNGVEKVIIKYSSGPKPKHLEEQEVTSPDGLRKLRVTQWSNGKQAATSVEIIFPSASSNVYVTNGIHDVKAYWKDNASVVIETKKEYMTSTQYREIRSFGDVITIEYTET